MKRLLLILALATFFTSLYSQERNESKQKPYLNLWVLIQNDVIYDLKQMDPDWIGGFRPSKIPIYNTDPGWGTNGNLYYSLRPSTFKFEGVIPVHHKWNTLKLRFEFDLFGMGVHAGETTIRFRLAYGDWGPFRIGKDWSTFIDLEAFPDVYDWWGPSGMALLTAPTIRFTHKFTDNNLLTLAFEVPGNFIDPGYIRQIDPVLINVLPKEMIPDFIAKYTHRGKFGYFKTAILLRSLEYEVISIKHDTTTNKYKFGWAINLSTGIKTFKDRGTLRLQTVFGHGYAGYNNDGGVELAPTKKYKVTVPFQYGFVAFYDFDISKKWSTSLGYSETVYDNSEGQEPTAFHRSQYALAQVVYNIIDERLLVGLNFQYGKKYNKDGNSADDQRILFNVTYLFSKVK